MVDCMGEKEEGQGEEELKMCPRFPASMTFTE